MGRRVAFIQAYRRVEILIGGSGVLNELLHGHQGNAHVQHVAPYAVFIAGESALFGKGGPALIEHIQVRKQFPGTDGLAQYTEFMQQDFGVFVEPTGVFLLVLDDFHLDVGDARLGVHVNQNIVELRGIFGEQRRGAAEQHEEEHTEAQLYPYGFVSHARTSNPYEIPAAESKTPPYTRRVPRRTASAGRSARYPR